MLEERISPSGLSKMPSLCPSPFENSFLTGCSWSVTASSHLPSLPFQICVQFQLWVPLELHHLFPISSHFCSLLPKASRGPRVSELLL